MTRITLALPLAAVLLCAAGCHENSYFSDDEGGPRHDTSATGQHDDELSLPYALGTSVGISLKGPVGNATGWSVKSDTPGVFAVTSQVDSDGNLTATGQALSEGEARISAVDENGHQQRTAQVTVRAADKARLFSHGDLRIVANDDESGYDAAEVTDSRILVGGKAVFAVAYYAGAERIYGRGIADPSSAPGLDATDQTSVGSATNEWLFVSPSAAGSYTLTVNQGATSLATLPVTAVDEAALTGISLAEQKGAKNNDKDQVWTLARASDGSGHEVLGVYCSWTLDGVAQQSDDTPPKLTGDLYRYSYQPDGAARTLSATRGALTANLTIHAHGGNVDDTTYLGCSALPGAPSGRAPLISLALLFLLLAARKITRRSGMATPLSDAPMTNERG